MQVIENAKGPRIPVRLGAEITDHDVVVLLRCKKTRDEGLTLALRRLPNANDRRMVGDFRRDFFRKFRSYRFVYPDIRPSDVWKLLLGVLKVEAAVEIHIATVPFEDDVVAYKQWLFGA